MIDPAGALALGNILVVEDDTALCEAVAAYLSDNGYRIHTADAAPAMDEILATEPIDLVVLDVMLPGEDGYSICRRLAEVGGPGIMMMSAMGEELDRVVGLELGADDYLPKPFSPRELLARIRAVLRRLEAVRSSAPGGGRFYHFLDFVVDTQRRQVRSPSGTTILLTAGELSLLSAFLDQPRRILSRGEFLEEAHGGDPGLVERSVDVQISRLRRKLHACIDGEIIRTFRGAGYLFDAHVGRS